jgi:FAD/FMN-containing dehydrogenase
VTANPTLPSPPERVQAHAAELHALCGGAVRLVGDAGYDAARVPWNVAVDQRPAAVAYPASADEVAEVVRTARRAGLRVAPQGTGHNPAPLAAGSLDDVVLVRTAAMKGVRVDPRTATARVDAGVLWQDAVEAASGHDLAALHGSSPDVGVVGYSLGGGIGWYARSLGLQASSVTAVELVTAEGELVRADAQTEPDLFWALRGGGGSFGFVTALEFRLYPVGRPYAGMLVWDAADAGRVLRRWAAWAAEAPDSVTTSFRIIAVPPLPEMPEPFRGRTIAMIDGAVLADAEAGAAVLAPLTELGPEMNTFASVPAGDLTRLHNDPEGPSPSVSGSSLLGELPDAAVEALLAAGPGADSSLVLAELRQLGGALGRPHPDGGALSMLPGRFAFFCVTVAPTPELAERGSVDTRRAVDALSPWQVGSYLNLTEAPVDTSTGYAAADWDRLRAVRATVDPDGLFLANHQVPPATTTLPRQR